MNKKCAVFAAALLAVLPAFSARAAVNTMADIVFVVDESGSMAGEHAWLGTMAAGFNTKLVAAGVTDAKFSLVGYGGSGGIINGHIVGGANSVSAASFATATGSLVTSGGTEDGYAGISYALSNVTLRGGAALNVILVTDEDRDNNSANTYASILAALTGKGGLLNAVVNNSFSSGGTALGVDSNLAAYKADGAGGFTATADGTGVIGAGSGTTKTDYIDMALATGGAAWDINQLRLGGNTAASFTAAFIDIKVGEIIKQPPAGVPDSGSTIVLFLSGLALVAGLRRRISA
jgi:hypothetical protein